MAFPDIVLVDNGAGTFDINLAGGAGSSGIKSISGVLFANVKVYAGVVKANLKKVSGVSASFILSFLKSTKDITRDIFSVLFYRYTKHENKNKIDRFAILDLV